MRLNATIVAEKIGWPVETWPNNCYAVASRLVKLDVVPGIARYGHWTGPIDPFSPFAGKPIVHHGWVDDGPVVIDPTRWVFENVAPYVYVGPSDYYDRDNSMHFERRGPAPAFDPSVKRARLKRCPEIQRWLGPGPYSMVQAMWLANVPTSFLEPHAELVYKELKRLGILGFAPIDNIRMVWPNYGRNDGVRH